MTNNVTSFDAFSSDQQIAAHQSGLVRVVLEGETDVKLFERFWFSARTDVFHFIEAGRLAPGAGCTGVAAAVAHSISEGVPAIGIVDRDTLFRTKEWDRLFSVDPIALNQDWINDRVYTASLWEVEAYLIEPELLADWVAAAFKPPPAPQAKCDAALSNTIEACRYLIAAAHYFAAMHEDGKASPVRAFSDQTLENLRAACVAGIGAAGAPAQTVAAQVEALVAIIIASQPAADAERLRFLLRYVDTKRLLFRLGHSLNIGGDTHWILASYMKRSGRRPIELDAVLDDAEALVQA